MGEKIVNDSSQRGPVILPIEEPIQSHSSLFQVCETFAFGRNKGGHGFPGGVPICGPLGDKTRMIGFAAVALGQIGPAGVPALIKALQDEDPNVRGQAAAALGQIGPAGQEESGRP